jgi:8-oxo-dGTP diphosphatase
MKRTGPIPTVDAIIECNGGIVLIRRKHPPLGWALPGGFVDDGETMEIAAVREAREETGLDVQLEQILGVYSDPRRDHRGHTMSVVFIAKARGIPEGGDDASDAQVFPPDALPTPLCFDHGTMLADYLELRRSGKRPIGR